MGEDTTADGEYTGAERALLDRVAASRGEEFGAENAGLILAQARLVGER